MPWEISYYQTPHNSQAQPFTYAALTQIVKLTPFLSGEAIQILLTNSYGNHPLTFSELWVSRDSAFKDAVRITKDQQTTFTIPAGQALGMDPIAFKVEAGQPLYFCLRATTPQTYVDVASTYDPSLVNAALSGRSTALPQLTARWQQRKSWFNLAGFRVWRAKQAPLVELAGDSLIETGMVPAAVGRHLLTEFFDQVALINTAISGSQLLRDATTATPLLATFGDSLLRRVAHSPWRPKVMVASTGGNDLLIPSLAGQPLPTMKELQTGFMELDRLVVQNGGALLVPTLGPKRTPQAAYGAGQARANLLRTELNQWLLTQPYAVDVTSSLADEAGYLAADCDFGDNLHLSPYGGQQLAQALFARLDQILQNE